MNARPYIQGFEAHQAGKTLDDNPYELVTEDGEAWVEGFEEARTKSQPTEDAPTWKPSLVP